MNAMINRLFWAITGYTALVLITPYYLYRMMTGSKYRAGLRQRLTLFSSNEINTMQQDRYVWFHTVSVGELQAARPLLQAVKTKYPHYKTWVTTVTATGQGLAKELVEVDACSYLPLDAPLFCRRFVRQLDPVGLVIFETELWPNLIHSAFQYRVPVALVNGRLSDQSFKNYQKAAVLFAPVLRCIHHIMAQSPQDRERFLAIGAEPLTVTYTGNIKFDAAAPQHDEETARHWRSLLHLDDELLLVAGSTFSGEELLLARMTHSMRNQNIPLKVLIAPRHIERVADITSELESHGFQITLRSRLAESTPSPIMILDTIGELKQVYAAADMVFIGKSVFDKGGQNPLEPAACGKPIVFGNNMQNFRDIAALLVKDQGAVQIHHADELQRVIQQWCEDQTERETIGQNAQRVVSENQGALERILNTLSPILEKPRVE